jgi:hypothetical protein
VAAGEQIAVPAQHRVRTHQQPYSAQHGARQPVQQGCQKRPITGVKPHLLGAQLPVQHGELTTPPGWPAAPDEQADLYAV